MISKHDPRNELLIALGVLAILGGLAATLAIPLLARSARNPGPATIAVVAALAVALLLGGIGLVLLRRAAGFLIAALSLAGAGAYLLAAYP